MANASTRFKGHRYYKSTALILPREHWDDTSHVAFGRMCKADTKGAIKTDYKLSGNPVYAKPIKNPRHTLTNLARSDDGYEYLAYNGEVWCRKWKTELQKFNEKREKELSAERELLERICADAAKMINSLECLAIIQRKRTGDYEPAIEASNALKKFKKKYGL